ncbi:hypothetical protein Pfo_023595 [Paulownia fortunei]|nr:hypothetical protein Pfo_023595 [Paulownia fortunei]
MRKLQTHTLSPSLSCPGNDREGRRQILERETSVYFRLFALRKLVQKEERQWEKNLKKGSELFLFLETRKVWHVAHVSHLQDFASEAA